MTDGSTDEPDPPGNGLVLVEGVAMMEQLAAADISRLRRVHEKWKAARAAGNWPRADRLRQYLADAGCFGSDLRLWLPVFESSAHRRRRIRRMEAKAC